jgi:integral membrane protein
MPAPPPRQDSAPVTSPRPSRVGRLFAVAAFLEAATWVGLLFAMVLKYEVQTPDNYVWLFGRLHGGMFLAYVVMAFVAGARLRWPGWALLLAVLAAVPLLVTVPLEMWYRRRGLLSAPAG